MKEGRNKQINFTSISDNEKTQLKNKITNSVYTYIKRKNNIRFGFSMAASIAILLSIGLYNYNFNKSSSIENFAKSIENTKTDSDEVILALGNDQNIDIAEENSSISYSNTGEKVNIGNSKTVDQSTSENNKPVYNTLIVPYGKRSEIELADGSKVWLNSGSKLTFPAVFNKNIREVHLEGEAIFEVAHNKNHPFIVKTNNHEIEVLGTVFNVSNYTDENSISTVLKSGSVQINYKNDSFFNSNESLKITPGTKSVYNRDTKNINTKAVDVEKYFSWKEGIFIFKNDSMESIMKKISRYYNTPIEIENLELANETFSGYLDVSDNIETVINTIKKTSEFEFYFNKENKLIIN